MAVIPEDQENPTTGAGNAAEPREPVCAVLRQAREAAGYEIGDVAQLLRIQQQYLAAIEDGRYRDLPGTVYAIGFVRTYSDFLDLDTTDIVRRFKEEASELSHRTNYVFPVPPPEARVPGAAVLVIGVLLAALAYSAWYLSSADEDRLADQVSEIPDRFSELASRGEPGPRPVTGSGAAMAAAETPAESAPGPAPTLDALAAMAPAAENPEPGAMADAGAPPGATRPIPATEPAPTVEPIESVQAVEAIRRVPPAETAPPPAEPVEIAAAAMPDDPLSSTGQPKAATEPSSSTIPDPSGERPAASPSALQPDSAAADEHGSPDPEITAAAAPPPPPPAIQPNQPSRYGLGNLNSRILIRATEMSWVQITDDLGNLVMTRVLEPGDSYRVPNTAGLTLASGNAGGLEVVVDGVLQPPLGLRGTVVRNVSLNPDAFGVRAGN